jgi:predicted DnaQ family exonuclease/DinG family helicase
MQSLVAIDIETTGLSEERDAIIEIGAVRFKGGRREADWSTFINPGRHIPEFITGLTGISDVEVRNAPRFQDVAAELDAFVGDSPIIGHNIRFDLGFLQRAGLFPYNEVIDTYELASVLMPTASRYNLGALCNQLGIPLPDRHRAPEDALATMRVFNRLLEIAQELPLDVVAELVRLSEPIEWDARWFFQEVLRSRAREGIQAKKVRKKGKGAAADPALWVDERKYPPLDNPERPIPLDAEDVASVLEYGGPFSSYFQSFEQRPEQVAMLRAVSNALSYGRHLMVEAGTGVGKCLTGDAWVIFRSGERRQIGEIVHSGTLPTEPIASVNNRGELIYQQILALHNNGIRPVWSITTSLGRKITATANHPFLTMYGWQHLCDLRVGDRLATLNPDHNALGEENQIAENIARAAPPRYARTMPDRPADRLPVLRSSTVLEADTSDHLYWDPIVSIEPAGQAETFDLTMEGEPNFLANDIVVHNSFAYLVPAALFALQNNTRVVVSTNTINLQDQLIQRDLPNLSQALNLDFRFAVLKGRSNYLCPRRLENLRHYGPRNADEMRVLAKVMVWQLASQSGDRSELNLTGPAEREVWVRLSAEDDACTSETCVKRTGGACPFYRARMQAQSAHVLVVNHALLLSDVATGSKVLPEYSHLIIDEGHHLESATTNALSFKLSQHDLERMMKEIGSSNAGILGRLLTETRELLRPADFGRLQQMVNRATDMAFRIEQMNREFFRILGQFAQMQREGQAYSNYNWQMRILPATRTLPGWDEVEIAWDATGETLRMLMNCIDEVYRATSELYAEGFDHLEDMMADISNVARRMSEAEANISGMIEKPNAGMVYWIEVQPNGNRLSLNAAPLSVASLVEKHLWHEKRSVILTSATLTAHGEFQYLRNTLGADEADEMQLGSPYDYESAALLYVATDIPEPNVQGYQKKLDETLIATAKATGGRMLVLFTSYAALKKTAQNITGPLALQNIYVYEQGDGASPNALLESFKATDRAVLLGTRSFWEGVDVPGEALSIVVLTKLPFDVPTDPLIAARSEMYEDSFQQYYLPEAILKFRQGFGRLIRTASDRGVVAILDRRVLTKQYGRLFLESLPRCTARKGPAASLPAQAAKWLGL